MCKTQNRKKKCVQITHNNLVLQVFNLDFLVVQLFVLLLHCLQKVADCFLLSFYHFLKTLQLKLSFDI